MRKAAELTAITWALSLAIVIVDFCPLTWWHPYCNSQADGPAYAAYGFPLPFAEPSGVSSLEYLFMPHMYALDVAVLSLAFFAVGRKFICKFADRTLVDCNWLLIGGAAVLTILITFDVWAMPKAFIPVSSIANPNYEDYFSYRPWPLAKLMGNTSCAM